MKNFLWQKTVWHRRSAWLILLGFVFSPLFARTAPPAAIYPNPPHLSSSNVVDLDLYWSLGDQELIVNGGFETGNLNGWTRSNVGGDTLINGGAVDPNSPDGPLPPLAGNYSSITDQNAPGTQSIYQDITIPPEVSSVMLSWSDRIRNHAGTFSNVEPLQRFRVEVRSTNNTVLTVIFQTEPGDVALANPAKRTADLSVFRGQRIRLFFSTDQNLFFFNTHLDNVSVIARARTTPVYDVYFGTNSVPGTNQLAGGTTNATWNLPPLNPATTYYWRIATRQGNEQTLGPIWQFSTRAAGPLDHFSWSPVSSQQSGKAFSVTLTARDAGNNVVTNFDGVVALSVAVSRANTEHRFLGDQSSDVFASYDRATVGYSFTPSQDILITAVRHLSGERVSIWTDAGALLASQSIKSVPGSWRETPLIAPLPLVASKAYRLGIYSSGQTTNFARFDLPAAFDHGTIHQSYDGLGDNFPTRAHPARWWLADLVYSVGPFDSMTVTPIVASNFVAGVWAGDLAIAGESTDVFLRAEDGIGHVGLGNVFSVLPVDTDGDGMPDVWESAHGLQPGSPNDATADLDGDGLTNLQEYLAGTDPREAASVIRITAVRRSDSQVQIRFTTVAGRGYRLEWTDSLLGNDWNTGENGITGDGSIMELVDPAAVQTKRFYRIRVLP